MESSLVERSVGEILEKKICISCGEEKGVGEFPESKRCTSGRRNQCRECRKKINEIWRTQNSDHVKEYSKVYSREYLPKWRKRNPEKTREQEKRYRKKHPEVFNAARKRMRAKRPEYYRTMAREGGKEWRRNNLEKAREAQRKSTEKRRKHPGINLHMRIANSLRVAMNGRKHGRMWETFVGYTLADLMLHLERLFQPGMSWENLKDWEIDHKIPVSTFNFLSANDEDFKRCWDINNIQPLWKKQNLEKGIRLDWKLLP